MAVLHVVIGGMNTPVLHRSYLGWLHQRTYKPKKQLQKYNLTTATAQVICVLLQCLKLMKVMANAFPTPGTDVLVVVNDPVLALGGFDLSACCSFYDGHEVVNFFPKKTMQV